MTHPPDQLPASYNGWPTLKAFGLALVLLTALEVAFRVASPHISGNVSHIREFDRLRHELVAGPETVAVFVGNSLTNNAIDTTYYSELASAHSGQPVRAVKFVPDATTLLDWRCVIDQLPPASSDDLLVIGYAWDQITDQQTVDIARTFGLICPLTFLRETSRCYDIGIGGWIEAGVAKLSMIYVLRERIRNGVLAPVVPHYETELQRMNDRMRDAAGAGPKQDSHKTYTSLTAALDRVRVLGYRLVMVAMPTARGYVIDPALPAMLQKKGVQFFDLRNEPWLRDDLFLDSIHLGPDGSRLLTNSLATQIYGYSLAGNPANTLSPTR